MTAVAQGLATCEVAGCPVASFVADEDAPGCPACRARRQRADVEGALQRVRVVHEPIDAVHYAGRSQTLRQVCTGCGTDDGNWQVWPCPTIRAIERDK